MPRTKRIPGPREAAIQSGIIEYLRMCGYLVERSNVGAIKTERGGMVKTGLPGSSDLKVYLPGGRTLHLEIKRPGRKLTEAQEQMQATLTVLGHTYRVANSIEDAVSILAEMECDG